MRINLQYYQPNHLHLNKTPTIPMALKLFGHALLLFKKNLTRLLSSPTQQRRIEVMKTNRKSKRSKNKRQNLAKLIIAKDKRHWNITKVCLKMQIIALCVNFCECCGIDINPEWIFRYDYNLSYVVHYFEWRNYISLDTFDILYVTELFRVKVNVHPS